MLICTSCGKVVTTVSAVNDHVNCHEKRLSFDGVLAQALSTFVSKMVSRLKEKHKEGHTGWDKAHPELDLFSQMVLDIEHVSANDNPDLTRLVDIANRCVFLYYRKYKEPVV